MKFRIKSNRYRLYTNSTGSNFSKSNTNTETSPNQSVQKIEQNITTNRAENKHIYVYTYTYIERERGVIHSSDAIVLIASDVEPSARVNESRIPALEDVIRIGEAPAKGVKSVALGVSMGERS